MQLQGCARGGVCGSVSECVAWEAGEQTRGGRVEMMIVEGQGLRLAFVSGQPCLSEICVSLSSHPKGGQAPDVWVTLARLACHRQSAPKKMRARKIFPRSPQDGRRALILERVAWVARKKKVARPSLTFSPSARHFADVPPHLVSYAAIASPTPRPLSTLLPSPPQAGPTRRDPSFHIGPSSTAGATAAPQPLSARCRPCARLGDPPRAVPPGVR